MNRNGDWIQTYTGKKFYPLDPRPEDICIEDIAHALANTCRYNGHSRVFYSVAEHCVRMSLANLPGCPKWLLMHDAAEAYISDVPRPVKPMLEEFKAIENSILSVIGEKFNLGEMDHRHIKWGDLVMLSTEKRDVLLHDLDWNLNLPEPLIGIIRPMEPRMAEVLFYKRAQELEII
jgi:hypothetical protein